MPLRGDTLSPRNRLKKMFLKVSTASIKGRGQTGGTQASKVSPVGAPTNPEFVSNRVSQPFYVERMTPGSNLVLTNPGKSAQDCQRVVLDRDERYERVHCNSLRPGEYAIYYPGIGKLPDNVYTFHVHE